MVVADLIKSVVQFVADLVGVGGVAVGAIAAITIVLFYGHELADIMFKVSRGLRMAVIVSTALVAVLLAGFWTGVLALDGNVGQLVDAIVSILDGVIH